MPANPNSPWSVIRRARADDDWQIVVECPGGPQTQYIKGLMSKADVDEGLAGTRGITWLRSQGYAR